MASLARPVTTPQPIDVGTAGNLVYGSPIRDVLRGIEEFLRTHGEWSVLWSIPRTMPDAPEMTQLAEQLGARLSPIEEMDIQELGMGLPLGEWADGGRSFLYRLDSASLSPAG